MKNSRITWFSVGWERAYEKRANGYGWIMPPDEQRRMLYARERADISFARENEERIASGEAPLWDGSIATLLGAWL